MLMELLVGEIVGPDLVLFALSVIKYDVYEVLFPHQVIFRGHHELLGLLFVVHLVVDACSRIKEVLAGYLSSSWPICRR